MTECPYCGEDLLSLTWKYWSGIGSERFEFICPKCGNNVIIVARLSFDIRKHKEIVDEIDNKTVISK